MPKPDCESVCAIIASHIELMRMLASQNNQIYHVGELLISALSSGNKIFLCGNGGSAADAQHIAAELVARFNCERRGLPAISLTTDTSIITAIGNDFGYNRIFSRQVESMARKDDILIGISTSGSSPNIVEAVKAAGKLGVNTIGLTGGTGGMLKTHCNEVVVVPSNVTARIQEAHILVGHIWCELIDEWATDEALK